jgi:hypothetical protein
MVPVHLFSSSVNYARYTSMKKLVEKGSKPIGFFLPRATARCFASSREDKVPVMEVLDSIWMTE